MVRNHHHDSSQLSMALFGTPAGGVDGPSPPGKSNQGYQGEPEPPHQQGNGNMTLQERRQREWEAANQMGPGGFWGHCERRTPPTDKPPDQPQHQFSTFHHPFDRPKQPPDNHPETSNQNNHPHHQQLMTLQNGGEFPSQQQVQQFPPFQQAFLRPEHGMFGGVISPNHGQMGPIQMPMMMPGTGYGSGSPVYVIMAPMGGGQHPMFLEGIKGVSPPNSQLPQSAQHMVLESIPPASAVNSRYASPEETFPHRETQGQGSRSMTRAKWGEKGVGVGHLWNPEDSVNSPAGPSTVQSPPTWADQNDDYTLPGGHVPGEKTHARGQAVVLDAQEKAERQRRQRQALETQRIIQQQLDEKKRKQEEEKEREKREAAIWEEKVMEQREKEKNEMEEEERKKREKEEAEAKRQEKLREAIEEAAQRAKKEKEARLTRGKIIAPQEHSEEPDASPAAEGPQSAFPKKEAKQEPEPGQKSPSTPAVKEEEEVKEDGTKDNQVGPDPKVGFSIADLVSSAQLGNLDQMQKLALLRALGIAPEFLLSSGAFEKSSFMSLFGSNVPVIKEDGGEYIRNVIVTPTKFRRARDCGVQCDEVVSDSYEEQRASRRRVTRRQKTKESPRGQTRGTPKSSPDTRPQWGKHKSERPYRKQSEKDPYSGRKLRRRTMRSQSISGQDSHTEESDPQTVSQPRRRRKTWDESRQESMSSDFSRSPSPRSRKAAVVNLPRGPPPIKPPLTPSLQQDKLPDSASSLPTRLSANSLSPTASPQEKNEDPGDRSSSRKGEEEQQKEQEEPEEDDADVAVVVTQFRSESPPVPALKGQSNFDIPEYPPGVDPNEIINRPLAKRRSKSDSKINLKNKFKKASTANPDEEPPADPCEEDQELITFYVAPKSPPLPAVAARLRKGSLPSIYTPDDPGLDRKTPRDEESRESRTALGERRASLTSGSRAGLDTVPKIDSATRPCSKTSLPSTPRRLPPMLSPPPLSAAPQRSLSPPVPAIQKKILENSIQARSVETMSLVGMNGQTLNQITPVEVTPRISAPAEKLRSASVTAIPPSSEFIKFAGNKKKESCDSGVSETVSRPSSASSMVEEQLATSHSSSSYDSCKSSFKRPKDLTQPLVEQDKWIVLKSFSNIRQNFWRKTQDLSMQAGVAKSTT